MRPLSLLAACIPIAALACAPASPPAPVSPPPPAPPPAAPAPAPPATSPSSAPAPPQPPDASALTGLDRILADLRRVEPLARTAEARRFLAATTILPRVSPRTLHHDEAKTRWFTAAEAEALPPPERSALRTFIADEDFYYNTRYGSPLSYTRALDLLFARGLTLPPGPRARVLDFGYGYIGHLRMLAAMGLDVTGVDVDPSLRALYSAPTDQGDVRGPRGESGHLRLLHGRFPADPPTTKAVGTGYQLILSKNVLKKGYINPDRPVQEKHRIRLGVSDDAVLAAFFTALAPGGWMLVYNICPAPSPPDQPFIPWSDGRSPFPRAQWEAAGFQVLTFDEDDTEPIRALAHALGWDQGEGAMNLQTDLSVLYTLVRKP